MNPLDSYTLISDLIMGSKDMTISSTSHTLWNLIPIIDQNNPIPTFKLSFAFDRARNRLHNHLIFPLWIIFLLGSLLLTLRTRRSWPRLSIFFWIVLFLILNICFYYILVIWWCLVWFYLFIWRLFWSFYHFLRALISFVVWSLLLSKLVLLIVHVKILLLLGSSVVLLLHLGEDGCLMM